MTASELHIIKDLLRKQLQDTLTRQEQEQLNRWIMKSPDYRIFYDRWIDEANFQKNMQLFFQSRENILGRLKERIPELIELEESNTRSVSLMTYFKQTWFRYAAAILLFTGLGIYLYTTTLQKPGLTTVTPAAAQHDVLPGSDKALLTLSNGEQVSLNSSMNDTITDGNLTIGNARGELRYAPSQRVVQNTMTTPRGGEYKLILADGTRVWLNAASSITYPTAFTGERRIVTITGEAFFEVAKNAAKPFIIYAATDTITVLGTALNINNYTDEAASKISLIDGAVKINNRNLRPGQAFMAGKIFNTNIEQDIAWKNGFFNFNRVSLADAMRQLSRWYDIDVIFSDDLSTLELGGEIERSLTLKDVLTGLQDKNLHFSLQGRTLTISK